ncbi:MAG TPA: hypothetical protein VMQ54_01085 [Steroidobacteraceae bacterium]|nr:hypothetical protein [Steroidobacteraceae bacterium]
MNGFTRLPSDIRQLAVGDGKIQRGTQGPPGSVRARLALANALVVAGVVSAVLLFGIGFGAHPRRRRGQMCEPFAHHLGRQCFSVDVAEIGVHEGFKPVSGVGRGLFVGFHVF